MAKAQIKSGILRENLKLKLKNEHCKYDCQDDGTDGSQEDVGTDGSKEDVGTDGSKKKEDVTYDCQEEAGTDDRCNKTDEASLFYGTNEIQEAEGGEANLHTHLASCMKNPGHKKFIPVKDFNINHLPEGYHDIDLVEYIKATADLILRVSVKWASTERPEFWKNTNHPYPCYDKRGSDVMILGTGMVTDVNTYDNNGTCPCHKCQHSDTPSKGWGKVEMLTAKHVVFDDLEARHTTCRLFFDEQDSPLVTLDGWTVMGTNIEEDWCKLEYVTCDVDLLDQLVMMRRHRHDQWLKVIDKYEPSRDESNWLFIVSHPHGSSKQISLGQWITKTAPSEYRTKYTYTTCTCPGSSGACVHSLGFDKGWYFYELHVHSGVNSEGMNFSTTGREYRQY